MSEPRIAAPSPLVKPVVYAELAQQLEALLHDVLDPIAAMASVASVVFDALPYASWVGFYRVVGPDDGPDPTVLKVLADHTTLAVILTE